jgi:hypothetical protein
VAVNYKAFKSKDRFQKPLTRGACKGQRPGDCDDSKIKKIVGVIATVVYLAEHYPSHKEEPTEDNLVRETYTYDLELEADPNNNKRFIATGGEWHYNSHPDFLWVPRPNSVAHRGYDDADLDVNLSAVASKDLTDVASEASTAQNYPLCGVLRELVAQSSLEKEPFSCLGSGRR